MAQTIRVFSHRWAGVPPGVNVRHPRDGVRAVIPPQQSIVVICQLGEGQDGAGCSALAERWGAVSGVVCPSVVHIDALVDLVPGRARQGLRLSCGNVSFFSAFPMFVRGPVLGNVLFARYTMAQKRCFHTDPPAANQRVPHTR